MDRVTYICFVPFMNRTMNASITILSVSFPLAMDTIRLIHSFSVSNTFPRSWQYLPLHMQCTVQLICIMNGNNLENHGI